MLIYQEDTPFPELEGIRNRVLQMGGMVELQIVKAMEGLSDVLRLEMRDTGVRVVLIEPGPITSLIRMNSIPHFERWINWRGAARAADYQSLLHEAKQQLNNEADYQLEAAYLSRYRQLLQQDTAYLLPEVLPELVKRYQA